MHASGHNPPALETHTWTFFFITSRLRLTVVQKVRFMCKYKAHGIESYRHVFLLLLKSYLTRK